MRRLSTLLTAGAAIGACGVCAAQASAAPTPATLPSITGASSYGSTLTCNTGTWSAGAGAFTETWQLADSNVQIGTGSTLKVRAPWVGLAIQCAVTATDTTGTATATSPAVTATPLAPAIKVTEARQVGTGKIAIKGAVSPVASLKGGAGSLILYLITKTGPEQISFNGSQTRPNLKTGAFTMTASGQPKGKNKYALQYVPSAMGYTSPVMIRRQITLR
jgi:hypothetical protein